MDIQLAKWELGKLLETSQACEVIGRDPSYRTTNRIDKLQKFLDEHGGEKIEEKPESNDDVAF